jgi:membrane protein implicated in regulation of membrane protease activity
MRNRLKKIPSQVYIRYGLLTIPGMVVLVLILIVVRNWVPIPFWLQVTLILLWVAKEVILFPFIWRAYDHTRSEVSRSMIGERGLTRQRLAPAGYIRIQAELWKAEIMTGEPPIEKDEWVRVIEIEGLKLSVVPEKADDRGQRAEDRGQRSEDRGQRTDGRGQRSEGRGRMTDDRGRMTDDRGRMTRLRSPSYAAARRRQNAHPTSNKRSKGFGH